MYNITFTVGKQMFPRLITHMANEAMIHALMIIRSKEFVVKVLKIAKSRHC